MTVALAGLTLSALLVLLAKTPSAPRPEDTDPVVRHLLLRGEIFP
jgi:hypothetical protein